MHTRRTSQRTSQISTCRDLIITSSGQTDDHYRLATSGSSAHISALPVRLSYITSCRPIFRQSPNFFGYIYKTPWPPWCSGPAWPSRSSQFWPQSHIVSLALHFVRRFLVYLLRRGSLDPRPIFQTCHTIPTALQINRTVLLLSILTQVCLLPYARLDGGTRLGPTTHTNTNQASSDAEQAPGPVPYTTQQEGRPPVYPATNAPGQPYPAPSGTPASEYGYSGHRGSTSFPDTMMAYRPAQSHPSNGVPSSNNMSGPSHAYTHPAYSSYAPPPPDVTSPYQHSAPSAGLYAQPRPDWANYQQNGPMQGHPVFPPTHSPAPAQTRQNQVRNL